MQQRLLYVFILLLSLMLVIIALGGGLFGQSEPWFVQWQHKLFADLCHRQPARAFWLGGQPMAVCSRCFGIYSGFFIGLLASPVLAKWQGFKMPFIYTTPSSPPITGEDFAEAFQSPLLMKKQFLKKLLLVTVLLNIVDVAGNMAGIWNNTLLSRFALGFSLALSAGLLLGQAFITQRQITFNNNSYGTNRSIQ